MSPTTPHGRQRYARLHRKPAAPTARDSSPTIEILYYKARPDGLFDAGLLTFALLSACLRKSNDRFTPVGRSPRVKHSPNRRDTALECRAVVVNWKEKLKFKFIRALSKNCN